MIHGMRNSGPHGGSGTTPYVLYRAATQVQYYRNLWEERRRHGDTASYESGKLADTEKRFLRERSKEFVADDCTISKMFHDHTSGTTGTSLDLWFSFQSVKQWYTIGKHAPKDGMACREKIGGQY